MRRRARNLPVARSCFDEGEPPPRAPFVRNVATREAGPRRSDTRDPWECARLRCAAAGRTLHLRAARGCCERWQTTGSTLMRSPEATKVQVRQARCTHAPKRPESDLSVRKGTLALETCDC